LLDIRLCGDQIRQRGEILLDIDSTDDLGARVRQTARCIRIHLATGWPFQSLLYDIALVFNTS
jgi:hypothetical protein